MQLRRSAVAGLLIVIAGAAGAPLAADREIEDGLLDWVRLRAEAAPGAGAVVVIRPFDTGKADLGTGAAGGKAKRVEVAREAREAGPSRLAEAFVSRLAQLGSFSDVRVLEEGEAAPAEAIVVSGAFTQLDPGNRAKRYWVGFGAGKSGVEVEGRVERGGETLAEFRQKRIAVMGVTGGSSEKKLAADCENIGEDIAEFLHAWVSGKRLGD